jgi:hypothetical protein
MPRRTVVIASLLAAALALAFVPRLLTGFRAKAFYEGDPTVTLALAQNLVDFEARDDTARRVKSPSRFEGEWALVTHQMVALGLAQLCLAHPEQRERLLPIVANAAQKSFRREMRDFGTGAWGEDALATLGSSHGHAYLAYPALALGMARLLGAPLDEELQAQHDALIAAYERRLLSSPTGLIETYPGEAYPTDVAAVAGAIAVHGRATGTDHRRVLERWATLVRERQVHAPSGFVYQRMGAGDGKPHDVPRGSGTGLAAYFAGFADRALARELAEAAFRHESSLLGFSAIDEYADGFSGSGDVDSGPVLFGVSVAATGFTLALARAHGRADVYERLYRTAEVFGIGQRDGSSFRFLTGGPIGNALLLALLTSGPELAR